MKMQENKKEKWGSAINNLAVSTRVLEKTRVKTSGSLAMINDRAFDGPRGYVNWISQKTGTFKRLGSLQKPIL